MIQIHININNYSACEPLHTQQQFNACNSAMAFSNSRTVISTHNTAHLLINKLFSLISHNIFNTNCNNSHQTKEQTF